MKLFTVFFVLLVVVMLVGDSGGNSEMPLRVSHRHQTRDQATKTNKNKTEALRTIHPHEGDSVLSSIVEDGARRGFEECQKLFYKNTARPWNCPLEMYKKLPIFSNTTFPYATKHSGLIHAINAAAIAYEIAHQCTQNKIPGCGCPKPPKKFNGRRVWTWAWGGCGDNIEFGVKKSKRFTDRLETRNDAVGAVNLYNNKVGREEPAFQAQCDHDHLDSCDRCDQLTSALFEIEAALTAQADNLPSDVNEELAFIIKRAKTNILAWKAHILRSIHQDAARIDALGSLDETSAFIVQDWAMKYLPRKYRESQSDWFGKRGISWHISVAFRKISDQIEMLSFVHVFQPCDQDNCAVLAVMEDVIRQLKTTMPGLETVSYRQDNAGCYHCGPVILCTSTVGAELGVKIKRLDYSDPQGGKGSCDRKAATIKSHMHIHLNEGHDIETPAQMCDAIQSSGGVPSVSVTLCDSVTKPTMGTYKIDGVSLLSNIEYSSEGIRVWRAYGVGPGRLILQNSEAPLSDGLPSIVVNQAHPSVFSSTAKRETTTGNRSSIDATGDKAETDKEHSTPGGTLFTCPEEGCTQAFLRHSTMIQHLDCGKHKRVLENESLYDKAAREYAQQLEGQALLVPVVTTYTVTTQADQANRQAMGWALKSSASRRTRFTPEQKSYLTTKFKLGEQTGNKANPAAVARSMMFAKDENGKRLFSRDDFLTAKQIAGFFSRLASKKALADDEDQVDIEIAVHEACLEEIVNQAVSETALKHPVVYDAYNLCDMASQKKLSSFSIAVLKDICTSFDIDTSDVLINRKKPYIDKLNSLCQECACQQ
ncbi:hypothetical protein ACROYT_G031932 [Oculina patagonica]